MKTPMKTLLFSAVLLASLAANAQVLSPQEANAICRKKVLAAAHFIADSNKPFIVKFEASNVAEISTPITYELTYQSAIDAGLTDPLFTVHAYAYPDDRTCLIGSVTNNIAGND